MQVKRVSAAVVGAVLLAIVLFPLAGQAQTGDRPETPSFTGTNPASGSNNNYPHFLGVAQPGTVVTLHNAPDCTGDHVGSGTPEEFANPGIVVHVPDNSTTTLWVHVNAGTLAGRQSHCSPTPITYVEKTPLRAAIKKCKKKFPKGSKKRKKCIKKAKKRAMSRVHLGSSG
jgi:hypothetical protein